VPVRSRDWVLAVRSGIITDVNLRNWWYGPRVLDETATGGLIRTAPARVNVDDLADFCSRLQSLLGSTTWIRTSSLSSSFSPVEHTTIRDALVIAPYEREVISLGFGEWVDPLSQQAVTVSISNNEALAATAVNIAVPDQVVTARSSVVGALSSLVGGSRQITPGWRWLGLLRIGLPSAILAAYIYLSAQAFNTLAQRIFAGFVGLVCLTAYREVDRALLRRSAGWCKRHDRLRIEVVSRVEQREKRSNRRADLKAGLYGVFLTVPATLIVTWLFTHFLHIG
jgi:hypothetical protein